MNNKLLILSSVLLVSFITVLPNLSLDKKIYTVTYSQDLEQPIKLIYLSSNRPTNVNRGSMDFYTETTVHTSDGADYANNVYDKGHLAPAATFSDNIENLKTTFSYLNCALQNQYLNRGEWRLLEEQERKWDDAETLQITVDVEFDNKSIKLPTGATVPSSFTKHIHFTKQHIWKCYKFKNEKPTKKWTEHSVVHQH